MVFKVPPSLPNKRAARIDRAQRLLEGRQIYFSPWFSCESGKRGLATTYCAVWSDAKVHPPNKLERNSSGPAATPTRAESGSFFFFFVNECFESLWACS